MSTVDINLNLPEGLQLALLAQGIKAFNDECMALGGGTGSPWIMVSKDGALVHWTYGSVLVPVTVDSLATQVRSHCIPGVMGKSTDPESSDPEWLPKPKLPRDLVRAYIETQHWHGVPRIKAVVTAPLIRPDFTIRWETGWDEATSTWVTDGLKEDRSLVDAGYDVLDLFKEFALTDPRQRADCLAAAFTPMLASAIKGALPGFIATAPRPASGKSELAQLMARIGGAGGDTVTRWPRGDEFTKTVSAFVRSDESVVIFDNIKSRVDSPDLESVITSRLTSFRTMRTHDTVKMASNTTWYFTVNGAHASADMLRRCVVVLLDTDRFPTPWTGTLPRWSRDNEAALVTLMCSLIDAWREAGCPLGPVVHDGFEEWSQAVSGILEHAGITGMWESRTEVVGEAVAVDGEGDSDIVAEIAELMGTTEFKSAELWKKACGIFDPGVIMLREHLVSAARAPYVLRTLKGRAFADTPYRLDFRKTNGQGLWSVVDTSGVTTPSALPVEAMSTE